MTPRPPRIIAFAGSLRADSYNKKLARNLAAGAQRAGAEVRYLDLKDFPLPVYDADLFDAAAADPHALHDQGGRVGGPHAKPMPQGLLRFKAHVQWADGWLVATPEHNRTFSATLHNLIDWLTRMAPGESPLDNFTYKVVGVVSAAYEGGGISAINDAKRILTGLGCIAAPGGEVVTITSAEAMFDADGMLKDVGQRKAAERTGRRVARLIEQIALAEAATT
jgi:NAD(P)H-dependent FMN reductase